MHATTLMNPRPNYRSIFGVFWAELPRRKATNHPAPVITIFRLDRTAASHVLVHLSPYHWPHRPALAPTRPSRRSFNPPRLPQLHYQRRRLVDL